MVKNYFKKLLDSDADSDLHLNLINWLCHVSKLSTKFHPNPSQTFWDILFTIKQRRRRRRHAEHETCKIHQTNLTSKIIGGWIQWPNMQILFKFQVNRMKNDNFRKLAHVDFLTYVHLLADVDLKNACLLISVTWYANPLQSSSQMDGNWGF